MHVFTPPRDRKDYSTVQAFLLGRIDIIPKKNELLSKQHNSRMKSFYLSFIKIRKLKLDRSKIIYCKKMIFKIFGSFQNKIPVTVEYCHSS